MLFFMDLSGDVLRIDADKIYQGTNDLPKIQLVTPITPNNTAIQVAFTLPNGITTVYYPMAVMGTYNLGDLVSDENITAPNVTQVYLWQITMPENVTLKNGTVIITFKVLKPTSVVTVDDENPFPTEGESGTYYIDDGTYYTWVEDVGLYAPLNTTAYADASATIPIGKTAQQYNTTEQSTSVRKAQNVRVVGDNSITYTQTDTASIINLDYLPNVASITASVDGEETTDFSYNATLNRIGFSATGTTYSVSYSLQAQAQTVPNAYFLATDCVTLQGHYVETTDTLSAFGDAYKVVTTSPVPFTVTYAALPAPPSEATEDQLEQLIDLLSDYYTQNGYILVDVIQKINSGELIGLGEPTATATTLPAGSQATASATIDPSSPADAKVIDFEFGIPKGDKGEDGATALSYCEAMVVTTGTLPNINTQNTFFLGNFNREPVENDTFYLPIHNATDGRDYVGYYRVNSVGESTVTATCFQITLTSSPQAIKQYRGTIQSASWEQVGNRYFYTIPASTHNLANPIVLEMLVETEDGLSNSFFSYNVKANRDVKFTSDVAVVAKYTLIGE